MYYTLNDVARILKIGYLSVCQYATRGELPTVKISVITYKPGDKATRWVKRYRITDDGLREFVSKHPEYKKRYEAYLRNH